MGYRFISDSHTHSECSFDGSDSVIMMCEQACALEMYSLTITDHFECSEYAESNYSEDIARSVEEVTNAREAYHDRLHLYLGIELGEPDQDIEKAKKILSFADYDYVLGSLHNLNHEMDFYYLKFTRENVYELLDRYFDEMQELVSQNLFDCLSHLDYPLRYIYDNSDINADVSRYRERIDSILETVVKNDKAIEINTSGLRQSIGRTFPDTDIIKRFKELGGRYVTIGSDAHCWNDVGAGIEKGLDILSECGFTHFTVYEKRCPKLLPIIC